MTIARANCRAVAPATASSIAPSRKWTCQSSGRRRVRLLGSVIGPRLGFRSARPYQGSMPATTLTDRALIRLSGDDVSGFLQGLVTNDLALLAPDRPLWVGLLTPQGKALFDFILWTDGEDVLIDCEVGAAGDLGLRRLPLYRLRRPIRIEAETRLAVNWSP